MCRRAQNEAEEKNGRNTRVIAVLPLGFKFAPFAYSEKIDVGPLKIFAFVSSTV